MVALFTPLFRVLANSLREEQETPEWNNLLDHSVENPQPVESAAENIVPLMGAPVFVPALFQDESSEFRRPQ